MNHFTLYKPEWKYQIYKNGYLQDTTPHYEIQWEVCGEGISLPFKLVKLCKEINVNIDEHSGTFKINKRTMVPYSDVMKERVKEAVDRLKDTLDQVASLFQEFDKVETDLNEKLKEMEDLKPYIKELVDGITEYK